MENNKTNNQANNQNNNTQEILPNNPDQLLSARFLERMEDEMQANPELIPFDNFPSHANFSATEKADFTRQMRDAIPKLIHEYRMAKGLPLRMRGV